MILKNKDAREWIEKNIKFFSYDELKCKCCGNLTIESELLKRLYDGRVAFNRAIIINSGYRCSNHNVEIKGATNSPHMRGFAVDIKCLNSQTRYELIEVFKKQGITRFGVDKSFLHIDVGDYFSPNTYVPKLIWLY